MSHSRTSFWKKKGAAAFTALATAGALVVPLSATAIAAPSLAIVPLVVADDLNAVSNLPTAVDSAQHIVALISAPAGVQAATVTFSDPQDGDVVGLPVTLPLAQVGTTMAWEAFWDQSEVSGGNDHMLTTYKVVDNDGETVEVEVSGTGIDPDDPHSDAFDITVPENGGSAGFNGSVTVIEGVASEDAPGDTPNLYYTTRDPSSYGSSDTAGWVKCGEALVTPDLTFAGNCDIGGTDPDDVTGLAISEGLGENHNGPDAVHVASAYDQTLQSFTVTPTDDTQSAGFCNTYVAAARDQNGHYIGGLNIDVTGTVTSEDDDTADDMWSFALNYDSANDSEGDYSHGFQAPDESALIATHEREAWYCDSLGEFDDRPDDLDDWGDGTPDTAGTGQDEHVGVTVAAAAPDTQHIESFTQPDFHFSVAFDTEMASLAALPVDLSFTAWIDEDVDENDELDTGEVNATVTKTFEKAVGTILDASPEAALNIVGQDHIVDVLVTDQHGNPYLTDSATEELVYRVTAGPHADNELDGDGTTPLGVFAIGQTAPDGTDDRDYTGTEEGTDTIVVFLDRNSNYVADAGEPSDTLTKTWVSVADVTCLDVEPPYGLNRPSDGHGIVAYVTDGVFGDEDVEGQNDCDGDPIVGIPVDFLIDTDSDMASIDPDANNPTDEPDSGDSERVITDANGESHITLLNDSGEAGYNEIDVWVPGTGLSEWVDKEWAVPGEPYDVACSPTIATNPFGSDHTVTLTATDAFGEPIAGLNADFRVSSGPNAAIGWFGEDTTDANGQASGTYTDAAETTGTDAIRCWLDENDDDLFTEDELDALVDKMWIDGDDIAAGDVEIDVNPDSETHDAAPTSDEDDANSASCDADFGDLNDGEDLDPDMSDDSFDASVSGVVNSVELICVSAAADDGSDTLMYDAVATLTVDGDAVLTDRFGNAIGQTAQANIESDGFAYFYVHDTTAETVNFTASVEGVDDVDTATKSFFAGTQRNVTCSPDNARNEPGTDHQVTCTVTDGFGNPVSGATITFSKVDSDGAESAWVERENVTDANGQAFATISSSKAGKVEITATIGGECGEAAGEDDALDVGAAAGNCTYTVTKIYGETPAQIERTQPQNQQATSGQPACVGALVEDTNGDPVVAIQMYGVVTDGPNAGADVTGASGPCSSGTAQAAHGATTDNNGIASFTYTPSATGTDTVTVWADVDSSGGDAPNAGDLVTTYTMNVEAPDSTDTGDTERLSGADRIATANAISQDSYPTDDSAGAVLLARSDAFPDALAGTPLAVKSSAPILLTESPGLLQRRGASYDINPATRAEIDRVLASGGKIYILGGEAAVGADAEAELVTAGYDVERLGGADRYSTAVAIANETNANPDNIIITTGQNFPDALSAGPAAAQVDAVIVLSRGSSTSTATDAYIAANSGATLHAIGGPSATAYGAVVDNDKEYTGATRLGTAVAVAEAFFSNPTTVGMATQANFPDALTGGAHIGSLGGPLLLTNSSNLAAGRGSSDVGTVQDYLEANAESVDLAYVYGGTGVVTSFVQLQIDNAITAS